MPDALIADQPAVSLNGPLPGRSCPLSYRYSPAQFNRAPELHAQTLYIVGGLYGNAFALDAIETLFAQEPAAEKHMVLNGDFHWFDVQPALFAALDARVQQYIALRGNVETEIAQAQGGADCGCAYPQAVDEDTVTRSNHIIEQLRRAAQHNTALCARLAALPMHLVAQVGQARVGIVHGDAESLAGWRFDAQALDDPAARPWLAQVFTQAQVNIFASSHTCAPALRVYEDMGGGMGAIINNGAAGMSSVPGTTHGIITRIGVQPAPHALPVLAGVQVAGVHIQALAVRFDAACWQQQFLSLWPEGSAAHASYWRRITRGPLTHTLHAPVDHHSRTQ